MRTITLIVAILFSLTCFSQTRFHPFAGIHASMDAGGYYIGPSFQGGTDYSLKGKTSLSAYVHYFPGRINAHYNDGSFEKGKYRSTILATLIQTHLSKKENKGCFLAGGIALQLTSEDYISDIEEIHSKRTIVVAAMRFGYLFPLLHQKMSFELNAVGPHQSRSGAPPYEGTVTEILTQLSGGFRIIF